MSLPLFYRKTDRDFIDTTEDTGWMAAALATLIEKQFNESPRAVMPLKQSTYHHVYLVTVKGQEFVFKAARQREFQDTLLLEQCLYEKFLKGFDFSLKVLASDLRCGNFPLPYIILTKADGQCLRDVSFSAPNFSGCIESLGAAVALFHGITAKPSFGLIDAKELNDNGVLRGPFKQWRDYLYLNLSQHIAFAVANGVITEIEQKDIQSIFAEFDSDKLLQLNEACLLHGDLGSHNIFVDGTRLGAIIDWEDALLGDPVFDIAMFASFYRMHEYLDDLMKGYRRTRPGELKGFDRKFWIYYLRIVIAKGVLRIKLGYDKPNESASSPKIRMALENLQTTQPK